MVSFWTLNHAISITGISEEEIVRAGKAGEFPFDSRTMLITSPEDFTAWVERRHIQGRVDLLAGLNEKIVKLYVKMGLLQRGLGQVEISLKELIARHPKRKDGARGYTR